MHSAADQFDANMPLAVIIVWTKLLDEEGVVGGGGGVDCIFEFCNSLV